MANSFYLGLDLGGTNIKVGLVDQAGVVSTHRSAPTDASKGPDPVVRRMFELVQAVLDEAGVSLSQIDGVGIGSPGPLDADNGVVLSAPNMPGWEDYPLRDRFRALTGRPTCLENDANAAAFGEFCYGAGRGTSVRDLVMLTLGTGVGSGIVIDGRIIRGGFGVGGETGHMIVKAYGRRCACGQRGCLETYASATAIVRRGIEAIKEGAPTRLRDVYEAQSNSLSAKDVFTAARQNDTVARQIIEEATTYLGIACVSLCRVLDPQMIVFAGGLILAGDNLFDGIRAGFTEHNWRLLASRVQIVPAKLGNQAGVIGAASVAMDAVRTGSVV